MTDRTALPSAKAETRDAAKAELQAAKQEQEDRIRGAMRRTFSGTGDAGDAQIVLKWLHDQAGYSESKVAANPQTGEINTGTTSYQAARETLYIRLRKYLTFDILKDVEFTPDQFQ